MSTIGQRLSVLERQRDDEGRCKGIRCFQQSEDDPAQFFEIPGAFFQGNHPHSHSDLRVLSRLGWQIIEVIYGPAGAFEQKPTLTRVTAMSKTQVLTWQFWPPFEGVGCSKPYVLAQMPPLVLLGWVIVMLLQMLLNSLRVI